MGRLERVLILSLQVKKSSGSKTLPSNNSPSQMVESPNMARRMPTEPAEAIGVAVVKYNYQAQQPDELSLVKGSRILILEKSNDGEYNFMKKKTVLTCCMPLLNMCLKRLVARSKRERRWLVSFQLHAGRRRRRRHTSHLRNGRERAGHRGGALLVCINQRPRAVV